MRVARALMLVCVAAGSPSSYAQVPVVSPISLVGKWSGSERIPNGSTIVVTIALTQSQKFTGSSAINRKVFWTYSGTWEVSGAQLTWHYEISSLPLPESAKADIDDIVAVDAEKLVLVSRLSGKRNVFLRIK